MADFLIDTPSHKRWMLPDGEHYYNSVIYGTWIHETVWNIRTNELVLSLPYVEIDSEGRWRELCDLAQALAEKKFRKRSKGLSYVEAAERAARRIR